MKKPNPNGAVIYRGPSMLDGAPIVVIVTGLTNASRNAKTGDMLQTWIMREDVHPVDALKGADASICGACPRRPALGGDCYVNVPRAPSTVWRCHVTGAGYVHARLDALTGIGRGRVVRLGAYGDPAAVPVTVWERLTSSAVAWTGYTHQWRTAPDALKTLCMASADSVVEGVMARAMGWKTFRVRAPGEPLAAKLEFICPASKEAGVKTTCAACRACMGTSAKARAHPVIVAH